MATRDKRGRFVPNRIDTKIVTGPADEWRRPPAPKIYRLRNHDVVSISSAEELVHLGDDIYQIADAEPPVNRRLLGIMAAAILVVGILIGALAEAIH